MNSTVMTLAIQSQPCKKRMQHPDEQQMSNPSSPCPFSLRPAHLVLADLLPGSLIDAVVNGNHRVHVFLLGVPALPLHSVEKHLL